MYVSKVAGWSCSVQSCLYLSVSSFHKESFINNSQFSGEKVLYTSYESKPGSSKIDGVWLGAVKIDGALKTALLINEWCEKNLVPDSARKILVRIKCNSLLTIS